VIRSGDKSRGEIGPSRAPGPRGVQAPGAARQSM